MGFIEELQWRGLIHDTTPGVEDYLDQGMGTAYIGIDPTSDSLHVGHLASIMLLEHFQRHGHRPIALVGGATGMIGDPSGKSKERNLLSEEVLKQNVNGLKKQLRNFLEFDQGENAAIMLDNYDWFRDMSFLAFIRDIGKHITVNYMMSKESVQNRLEAGMSFTEFTYQLAQGYDFLHLYRTYDCRLQMGGSDQWGNIVTGTELIRRLEDGTAYALTSPLITKADGSKFGKTEEGTVWLDAQRTSPYKFYQFWLNAPDEDAYHFLKIFTLYTREEIEKFKKDHEDAPHQRIMQQALAEDVTTRVHSGQALETAKQASRILFGRSTTEELKDLPENQLLEIFEGVPHYRIPLQTLSEGVGIIDFLAEETGFMNSKGEARRALKENAIRINKEKVDASKTVGADDLISGKYIVGQRGKKNYFLVIGE